MSEYNPAEEGIRAAKLENAIRAMSLEEYKAQIAKRLTTYGWTSVQIAKAFDTFNVKQQKTEALPFDEFVECARFATAVRGVK